MTAIVIKKGDKRIAVDADVHNGYLVEVGTKIPFINKELLEFLPEGKKQKIISSIEEVRHDEHKLDVMWRDGSVLKYTIERPQEKFNYLNFLKKLQNRDFYSNPIEKALSPIERQYFLETANLYDFQDSPSLIIKILGSLSEDRLKNFLPTNSSNIADFVVRNGSLEDVSDFFNLLPKEIVNSVIAKGDYAILLDAIHKNKQDVADVILEFLEEEKTFPPKELEIKILKSAVGETLHPAFNEDVYHALLPVTIAACKAEGNTGAVEHAYKLAVLFNRETTALNYLEKYINSSDSRQPVHDALLFRLPNADDHYDRIAWAKLATNHGMAALKYFGNAEAIETAIEKLNKIAEVSNDTPIILTNADPKELARAAKSISFIRYEENPKWADLCGECGVGEDVFNNGLDIFKQIKKEDNTPDIGVINGEDIGCDGYYMRKLSASDPRNLLIGKLVKCCNHIDDGATDYMAVSHVTSPDAACYVIFKEEKTGEQNDKLDKPVAKATGWMSQNNNFVFNSWERLGSGYSELCEPFFSEAGRIILNNYPEIGRVLLGRNRDSVEKFPCVDNPEIPRTQKTSSHDSERQYLIAQQERTAELEQQLRSENSLPEHSFFEEVMKQTSELGLTPTQTQRLHKKLEEIKGEIEELDEIALEIRKIGIIKKV